MTERQGRRLAVPVLMYHDIGSPAESSAHGPYVVSSESFNEQMRVVTDCGLGGTSLEDRLERDRVAVGGPPRSCVITFDDGHESNVTRALPALQEAGFRATFFVTAGWIGRSPYLSWSQLRELSAAGMEIGSHSMTHRPPSTLRRSELFSEMADSKKLLEDRLGQAVRSASSPTGFFNPEIIPVTMEAGYHALCVGRIALWTMRDGRFGIPRLPVKQRTRPDEFRCMVLGDRRLVARLRGEQVIRDGLKGVLGVRAYLHVRRAILRVLGSG